MFGAAIALLIRCLTLVAVLISTGTAEKFRSVAPNADVQGVVDRMRSKDYYAPRIGDVILDFQQKVSEHHFDDYATEPLMTYVYDAFINNSQIYTAYEKLWPYFDPDVTAAEQRSAAKDMAITSFLNAVMQSAVFSEAYQFLQKKGLASSDYMTFRDHLKTMWFGEYARNDQNICGSSGFEHVFLGEWETGGNVGGQHHWVRYHKLEQTGAINYHGYLEHDGCVCATIQYEWAGYKKPIGGFLVGTTVEFDFSLFTLCWLMFPNSADCTFKIDDYDLAVEAFQEQSNNQYVGSTYPKIVGNS